MEIFHTPVMVKESLELLSIEKGEVIVDCTIGEGGHSIEFMKHVGPEGFLIGIDLDSAVLNKCFDRLSLIGSNFKLFHENFKYIFDIVSGIGIHKVDKIFADLGMSSFQLSRGEYGFSFRENGPLDLRMNKETNFSAMDVVNQFSEKDISSILWLYGEERFSRRIARKIIEKRKTGKLKTTLDLANLISAIYPIHNRKIHPATKTFQALRIYVNGELENLHELLCNSEKILRPGGIIGIISYHSLEDRIVKNYFKANDNFRQLTKKPIKPTQEELRENRRARSAKMRFAEIIT
jgi:16S rRNA (cytosine1402-N4)-methyltransferase